MGIFKAIDDAIDSALKVGDKAFESVLLKPMGDFVGTLCGDAESAKSLVARVITSGITDGIDTSSD